MLSHLLKTKKGKLIFWIALSTIVLIVAGGIWYAVARASIIEPPAGVVGYFGDLTVLVKDKTSNKPILGAEVSFAGRFSNEALNRAGAQCSNYSLTTSSDGKALFTKANGPKNIKTWAEGYLQLWPSPWKIKQQGYCIYTMTTTPLGGTAVTQTISWPKRPGQDTNLGTTEVLVNAPQSGVTLNNDTQGIPAPDGAQVTLTWATAGFDKTATCTASGSWSGKKTPVKGGTEVVTAKYTGSASTSTSTYILTCKKANDTINPGIGSTVIHVLKPTTTAVPMYGKIYYKNKLNTKAGTLTFQYVFQGSLKRESYPVTSTYIVPLPTGTYPAKVTLTLPATTPVDANITINLPAVSTKDLSF